jgi:hypothetical protein
MYEKSARMGRLYTKLRNRNNQLLPFHPRYVMLWVVLVSYDLISIVHLRISIIKDIVFKLQKTRSENADRAVAFDSTPKNKRFQPSAVFSQR